jgi:hypothetical protein
VEFLAGVCFDIFVFWKNTKFDSREFEIVYRVDKKQFLFLFDKAAELTIQKFITFFFSDFVLR